jgi:hypothetical protein
MLNAGCAYVFAHARRPLPAVFFWFVAFANMLLAGFLGRMFSPLLIGPGLAAGTMLGFSFHPRFGKTYALAAGLAGALLAPWVAERLGLLSRTIIELDGMIGIRSPAGAIDASRFELAHVVYVVATVFVCGALTERITRAQRDTRRTAHLQAWHLRQLVPLEPHRR